MTLDHDKQNSEVHEGRLTFDNGVVQLWQADARHLPLGDASVDVVVTSPP